MLPGQFSCRTVRKRREVVESMFLRQKYNYSKELKRPITFVNVDMNKAVENGALLKCAGFMRIADGKNPLDNTGVHPESYDVCKKMIEMLGYTIKDIEDKK